MEAATQFFEESLQERKKKKRWNQQFFIFNLSL